VRASPAKSRLSISPARNERLSDHWAREMSNRRPEADDVMRAPWLLTHAADDSRLPLARNAADERRKARRFRSDMRLVRWTEGSCPARGEHGGSGKTDPSAPARLPVRTEVRLLLSCRRGELRCGPRSLSGGVLGSQLLDEIGGHWRRLVAEVTADVGGDSGDL